MLDSTTCEPCLEIIQYYTKYQLAWRNKIVSLMKSKVLLCQAESGSYLILLLGGSLPRSSWRAWRGLLWWRPCWRAWGRGSTPPGVSGRPRWRCPGSRRTRGSPERPGAGRAHGRFPCHNLKEKRCSIIGSKRRYNIKDPLQLSIHFCPIAKKGFMEMQWSNAFLGWLPAFKRNPFQLIEGLILLWPYKQWPCHSLNCTKKCGPPEKCT